MKANSITKFEDYVEAKYKLKQRLLENSETLKLLEELELVFRYEFQNNIFHNEYFNEQLSKSINVKSGRIALISDIHGNYEGLLVVLNDIEQQNCDRIICLGDLVDGGGAGDEKVVNHLFRSSVPCVRGNHDEFNDAELPKAIQQLLKELPLKLIENDILFTHISPREINRKINHSVEAWNVFDESDYRLIFVGHSHKSFIFGEQSESYGISTSHDFKYNQPFSLSLEDRYIVSVGSVGYGRDQVGLIRYAIYDSELNTIEHRAIDGPLLSFDYTLI